jgi:thiamine pyrophosphate-dependent acetolactate synthase large subunit-like protein
MDSGEFLTNINKHYENNKFVKERNDWKEKINYWKKTYPIIYNKPKPLNLNGNISKSVILNKLLELYNNNGNFKIDDNLVDVIFNKLKRQYIDFNYELNTQMVIEQINKSMDHDNTIITSGVGNHQMMASQFITWTNPKQFITSGSSGVMGVGLPYAIGAQIANPSKIVVDIDGDGSFNHTLADLQTVFKHNLPIKIFIMNDGHMSMVKAWEKLFFNENYVTTNCSHNPDYNLLATAYGIHSVKLNKEKDLQKTIEYVLNYKGPIICNCMVKSDLCLPLVAPGKALDDIFTTQTYNENNKMDGDAPS